MHVHVDSRISTGREQPRFRGLRHLVTAIFGEENAFVFDLHRRRIVATVGNEVAADRRFWDHILLPITVGVLGPALGVVPVHAACLTFGNEGMLIAGESGAGKSTLSLALAQNGFGYISDDWSYLSMQDQRIVAHGLSVPVKLLPDAVHHFSALSQYQPALALNGELAYELPAHVLGATVRLSCKPRWFFFLERSGEPGFHVRPISSTEAQSYVERSVERLPPELDDIICARAEVIEELSQLSCWHFCYSGTPEIAVQGLRKFLAEQRPEVSA